MMYQEGLITLPWNDSTPLITKGQALKWGADGSATGSYTALNDVADTAASIFAVAAEAKSSSDTTTNLGTPVLSQIECQMVDNPKIWKIYYEMETDTDLSVGSISGSVISMADTLDDNLDGSWVYLNSGTGIGQLRYVSAADTSTLTVNTAFTTDPTTTTDLILIRPQGIPEGGVALNAEYDKIVTIANETTSQMIIILKNFVEGPTGTQELDITKNSHLELDGLNTRGVRFYSHIIFIDSVVNGAANLT